MSELTGLEFQVHAFFPHPILLTNIAIFFSLFWRTVRRTSLPVSAEREMTFSEKRREEFGEPNSEQEFNFPWREACLWLGIPLPTEKHTSEKPIKSSIPFPTMATQ